MKIKVLTILILSIFIFTAGCEKIKEAATFDVYYELDPISVEADSALYEVTDSEVLLYEETVHINLDSLERRMEIKKVESATFDYIRVQIETPPSANLNWIGRLRATVSGAGIDEVEVGTYDGSKTDARIIDLNLNEISLTPLLANETFIMKVYARIRPPLPASTTTVRMDSRIRLTVQPL